MVSTINPRNSQIWDKPKSRRFEKKGLGRDAEINKIFGTKKATRLKSLL
jgi:hypothetical protein